MSSNSTYMTTQPKRLIAKSVKSLHAVRFGIDWGKPGGDRTGYFCSCCGPSLEPCKHVRAYLADQKREIVARRMGRLESANS